MWHHDGFAYKERLIQLKMESGKLKMGKNIIDEKSYEFAIKTVKLYKWLCEAKREFILSKQLLRCGTAVGALVREAEHGQSKLDFLNKMNIALKEANESLYWISLLKDTGYIEEHDFTVLSESATELVRILASIVKTIKFKVGR